MGALGLPALCCDGAGFEFAATAERLSATVNATTESVVFTIFLLWVFLCRDKKPILQKAKRLAESMLVTNVMQWRIKYLPLENWRCASLLAPCSYLTRHLLQELAYTGRVRARSDDTNGGEFFANCQFSRLVNSDICFRVFCGSIYSCGPTISS